MKRFLAKIGRFFWSRGFLKFVLWTTTLIILFYVEEDWRGARAWAATKAKWEAKGESFDFNRLIPPPVPDDQNLAAIPLFKMEPDPNPEDKGRLTPLALHKALRMGLPGNNLIVPHPRPWEAGELPDMGKIREVISTDYTEAFKTAAPSNDSLAQFDALYPFITNLRAASASRPYCCFPFDGTPKSPSDDFFSMITVQIAIARVLNFHAVLALDAHKPEVALADIKTCFKFISGLRQEPFKVSNLVAIGMLAISGKDALYDGLAWHSWNDAQLADLQNELARMDFLSVYQRSCRGAVDVEIPAYDSIKINRPRLMEFLDSYLASRPPDPKTKSKSWIYFPDFWANGWIDQQKAHIVTFNLTAVQFVDPKARLVFPRIADQFAAEIDQRQHRWDGRAPWNVFSNAAGESIAKAVMSFAEIQVWIDEARIACALERYRLSHGAYADSLDVLEPACIEELPHDIFGGGPYHYQLHPDGTYLLYSVGWNQTDDGGKVIYKKDSPQVTDYKSGDWIWPIPHPSPQEAK